MFTATITNKEEVPAGVRLTVDFTNGTKTITEQVIPQDRPGLEHWIKSRIASLNSSDELLAEDNVNKPVVLSVPTEPTTAEKEKREWFRDFNRLEQVQKLINLGTLTGVEPQVVTLRDRVKGNFRPAYIADM